MPRAATRLLVIDDSVLVRRLVSRTLAREPHVEVVGSMRNSRAAVVRSGALRPDVVLLDAEAAVDDDCLTLSELRREQPGLRIVMRGERDRLDEDVVLHELLPAILGVEVRMRPAARRARSAPSVDGPAVAEVEASGVAGADLRQRERPIEAIAVAASTGGPDALDVVLAGLPASLAVPVFVVQHMPAEFTRMLAERLDRRSALPVVEASGGELVGPGRVYIAPGGRHLALARAADGVRIVVHDGPRENSCRPAADVLFRSAADVYGAGLLAIVLTGMGRDGLAGAEVIRRSGGHVIAQSEGSSVIASMPAAVATAGLADAVLDLGAIGPSAGRLVAEGVAA